MLKATKALKWLTEKLAIILLKYYTILPLAFMGKFGRPELGVSKGSEKIAFLNVWWHRKQVTLWEVYWVRQRGPGVTWENLIFHLFESRYVTNFLGPLRGLRYHIRTFSRFKLQCGQQGKHEGRADVENEPLVLRGVDCIYAITFSPCEGENPGVFNRRLFWRENICKNFIFENGRAYKCTASLLSDMKYILSWQ